MSEKVVTVGGEQSELALEHEGSIYRTGEHTIEIVAMRGSEAELRVDGRSHTVPFVIDGTMVSFSFDGEIYTAEVADKGARAKVRHRDHSLAAPMPGVVLKILVKPDDVVAKGAALLILEAMKMEHQIVAPHAGRVTAVNCKEGELVQPGVDLVGLEKSE